MADKRPASARELALASGLKVEYRVTPSRGTRTVRLRILPGQGLVVSAPAGVGSGRIEEILHEKARWIERHLARIETLRPPPGPPPRAIRPALLPLRALGESWRVEYEACPARAVSLTAHRPDCIHIAGNVDHVPICQSVLRRWLTLKAQRTLVPRLGELARETGFSYARVSVRGQRSRWGSCSASGAISLNFKLLFLPPELMRYVLLHELCHTRELNHSRRFWDLLASVEPASAELDARMKDACGLVPAWLGMGPGDDTL